MQREYLPASASIYDRVRASRGHRSARSDRDRDRRASQRRSRDSYESSYQATGPRSATSSRRRRSSSKVSREPSHSQPQREGQSQLNWSDRSDRDRDRDRSSQSERRSPVRASARSDHSAHAAARVMSPGVVRRDRDRDRPIPRAWEGSEPGYNRSDISNTRVSRSEQLINDDEEYNQLDERRHELSREQAYRNTSNSHTQSWTAATGNRSSSLRRKGTTRGGHGGKSTVGKVKKSNQKFINRLGQAKPKNNGFYQPPIRPDSMVLRR